MKVAVVTIEKLDGITGYYQNTKRNTLYNMAYKKNIKKLKLALVKLEKTKQKNNETSIRSISKPRVQP